MSYTKTTWRNNQSPAINADNLNHIEQGIYDAHDGLASANNNMELMDNRLQAEIDDANSDISTLESNLAAETSARTQQDSVLSARMDTFTQLPSGSTSGDAELIDIRVGADGTTYPTAGDAVRGQVTDLKSELNYITDSKETILADSSSPTSNGYIAYTDGNVAGSSSYQHTDFIDVHGYARLEMYVPILSSSSSGAGVAFYKNDYTYISGVSFKIIVGSTDLQSAQIVDVPTDAVYVRTACRTAQKSDFYIKGIEWFSAKEAVNNIGASFGAVAFNGKLTVPQFDIGFTINSSGVIGVARNYALSNYMNVCKSGNLIYAPASNDCVLFVCEYDESQLFIQRTRLDDIIALALTDDTAYIRFVIGKTSASFKPTTTWIEDNFNVIIKSPTSENNLFLGMQMFEKIGVIGDSIACGWAKDKNGNNSRRNIGISWVQQMARRLGCTAYNLGASGVDPIEWFQNNYEFYEYCYPQYVSVGACDLYIVGLGLNYGTLGTIADVNESDYTQNGATFYGQYARIVQMINDEHPNAIVMCLTEPTTAISSYDQAVRDICALNFIKAELVDLENDYFDMFNTPEILAEHQPDGLHFTPYGYSLIAEAMMASINDYISKKSSAFKYVGVATV